MDIKFINHASLLLAAGPDCFVLTDPWYLSPAFGGWTPKPSPPADLVRSLLAIPPEQLHVVVSHGHDDHLDEFFISKHLRGARFYVPGFKTNGLAKRIERLTGVYPVELGEACVDAGVFALNCLINPDFTQYDAIITIRGDDSALIHANDNWHAYPQELVQKMHAALAGVPPAERFFFVQFGIADCFPLNFPTFAASDMERLVEERFEAYHAASLANFRALNAAHAFHYANQSIYAYPEPWNGGSLYESAQEFLRRKGSPYRQCIPGTNVRDGSPLVDGTESLFEFCLRALAAFINNALHADLEVRLAVPGSEIVSDAVTLEAQPAVWARILIGELTLEAIIIGGLGLIHKPASRNISDIHHKLSKLAYLIQARIQQQGLNFYFGADK